MQTHINVIEYELYYLATQMQILFGQILITLINSYLLLQYLFSISNLHIFVKIFNGVYLIVFDM